MRAGSRCRGRGPLSYPMTESSADDANGVRPMLNSHHAKDASSICAKVGSCASGSCAIVVTILGWMVSGAWQFFWFSASTLRLAAGRRLRRCDGVLLPVGVSHHHAVGPRTPNRHHRCARVLSPTRGAPLPGVGDGRSRDDRGAAHRSKGLMPGSSIDKASVSGRFPHAAGAAVTYTTNLFDWSGHSFAT